MHRVLELFRELLKAKARSPTPVRMCSPLITDFDSGLLRRIFGTASGAEFGSNPDVVIAAMSISSIVVAEELQSLVEQKIPTLNAAKIVADRSLERSVVLPQIDMSIPLIWVRNIVLLPVLAGVISNWIFALLEKRHRAKSSSVRVTLLVDVEGTTQKVQFIGPADIVASQIDRFDPHELLVHKRRRKKP